MIYCPNPDCLERENIDERMTCQTCQTTLVIKGRYRLMEPLRKISLSGCAEVFTVQDLFSTTKVMKILRVGDPKLLELFDREARVLQELDRPSIPQMEADGHFSFQTAAGLELKCLVMEKIAGVNLEQWLQENHYCPPDLALQWLKQIVDILEYLHQHQLFHRDIKPANIMLKPDGQIAIVDFGAVRRITDTVWSEQDITVVHTPAYAPPEQLEGQAVPQSDFYSLGRTFVHLLTGQSPLDFLSGLQWRSNLSHCIPTELADLVDNLMNPLVTKRPKSLVAIRQQLQYIEKKQASSFWNSIFSPKRLHLIKIINALPLIVLMYFGLWKLAWKFANDWNWQSIEPLSSREAKSLVGMKVQCSLSINSRHIPLQEEQTRSSIAFSFDKFIREGDIFYVQIFGGLKANPKFDLKQDAQDENINYFDRTMIKNMTTGFYIYKYKIQHPLYPIYKEKPNYPVYIANPKNTNLEGFNVKFCRLKL
jgi:serine/threonine protein kinase